MDGVAWEEPPSPEGLERELSYGWDEKAVSAALAAGEEGLPEGEDYEVFAELFLGGLAELADAFFGNAQLGGDVVERGVFEIVAAEDAGVVRRQAIERGAHGRVRIDGLGGARRAGGLAIDERVELLAMGIGLVGGAGLGGEREAVELRDGGGRVPGDGGNLARVRRAAEVALERLASAAHERDLRARVARERVEPAELIEERAADAHEAVRAGLLAGTVEAQERLDQGELAGAREIVTRDVDREPAVEGAEHRIDDIERVGERIRQGL